MRVAQGAFGRGRAGGIGLYLDQHTRLERSDNREAADGFLGVFANFRVTVIGAPSGRVLADDVVTSGSAYSAARSTTTDLMSVLTGSRR